MKALKTTAVAILLGASILAGCQPSTNQAQESPSPAVTTSASPSPSPSPKVVKPSIKAEVKPSPVETPAAQETPVEATPTPTPEETVPSTQEQSGYVAGTCKELKAQGLSDFRSGDPNYTSSRDRDGDGVACES